MLTKRMLKFFRNSSLKPISKVVFIEEMDDGYYSATIQLIGKNITYKMNPEDILIDNKLTGQFSPHDIRTLTYLGYLGMNSPKYRILAQRLAENDKMLFLIQEKGKTTPEVKSAEELARDKTIIEKMSPKDSHLVGYVKASEHMLQEKNNLKAEKETLLK